MITRRENSEDRPRVSAEAQRRLNSEDRPRVSAEAQRRLNSARVTPEQLERIQRAQRTITEQTGRLTYRGAASRRTRAYARRGEATGNGAAVANRAAALRERYGNDPRIARAAANIMANSYT